MKKLKKSNNRVICGVCGGLAEYLGIDATVMRLIVCVLAVFWGTGLLVYIVAALIMPSPDSVSSTDDNVDNLKSANINEKESKSSATEKEVPHSDDEFDSYFKK